MVTSAPCDCRKPFIKEGLDYIELPLHQNHIYWPPPTTSLEQALLVKLSCCASFLVNTLFSFSGDSLTYLLTVMIITKLVIITYCCLAVKLCPTLLQLHGLCSLPGSSVHEISQARILEWLAISFSGGSSQSRDWTHVSCVGRQILYHWVTREAPV